MAILLNPEGVIGEVPDAQFDAALAQGYSPAAPEAAQAFLDARQRRETYGTTGQAVLGGAEAAARALTLGLSTGLETAIGIDPEGIAAREEVNPVASGIGTVGGIALPLILSGGTSALAQGAGKGALAGAAELSAPSLIARAGRGVVGALEGTGAEFGVRTAGLLPESASLAGQIARKAVAEGLGSAVEGAAYGAGEVVHEGFLGNPDLTAQSALATVGTSALLGGAAGAALGVAGPSISAAARKARSAVEDAFHGTEDALKGAYRRFEGSTGVSGDTATVMIENKFAVEELAKQAPKVAEDLSNATPEMAQFILRNKDRFVEMERAFPGTTGFLARADVQTAENLLENWPKILTDPNQRNVIAENLFNGAKNVLTVTEDLLKKANKEILPAERDALLSQIRGIADRKKVELARIDILDRVAASIREMRSEPELYSPTIARSLEKMGEGLERDIGAMKKGWRPADEVFERLRTFKQQTGHLSNFGKDRVGMSVAERNGTAEIARLWGATKGALTDETIFGPAAVRQSVIDDIQHEWISLTSKKGDFYKQFMTQGKRGGELKPTKVSTWLNQMADAKPGSPGDLRGREAAETWGRMMDAAKRITNEVEQSSKNTTQRLNVEDIRDLFEKADAATKEARERASITVLHRGLNPGAVLMGSHPIISSPAAQIAQQAAGMTPIIGGALRTTINIAKGAVSVPRTVAVLASLERTGAAVGRKIDTLASTLVRGGVKAANIGRAEVEAGIASEFAQQKPPSFAKQADQIRTLANDPAAMMQSLDELTDDLHEHAPDTAQAIGLAYVRGVQFLDSKLPKAPPRTPLGPKWEPSTAEIAKFNRYKVAVDEPLSILKQASAGTLTPEGVEAVKTVYPDLYTDMQTRIVEALTMHPDVPPQSRMMLSMLVGMDLDGSIAQLAANQKTYQAPTQRAESRPMPGAASLDIARRTETPAQRAAAR